MPSRKGVKKAIKRGFVKVNGDVAETGRWIKGGEQITYTPPAPKAPEKWPRLELKIHFEDDYLAVVEKPAGLLTSGNKWMTLVNVLPNNLRRSSASDALEQPQPAHRLDYPTSGLVVIGKSATSLVQLNQLFEKKQIQKTYHAVAIGELPERGIIDLPVDDKPAQTSFVRLKRLTSRRFGYLSLVRLHPATGRRHQLRQHLASLNCPILGDPLYSPPDLLLKGKGLYLHASHLSLRHPVSGEPLEIESELPKKFSKLFPSL